MKRFIKWSLILGVICCVLGIGTITAGAMMGGMSGGLHRAVMDGQAQLRSQIRSQISRQGAEQETLPLETLPETTAKAWNIPGTNDDPLSSSYSYSGVRRLEIEMLFNYVELREWDTEDGDTIAIGHTENEGIAYKIRQNGDRLELKVDEKTKKLFSGETGMEPLLIYVPQGYMFDKVEIENNMGSFQADVICARELSLECNAGEISIGGGSVNRLDAECNTGTIHCLAVTDQDADVECDAGEVWITLAGGMEGYDYDMECDIGQILINGEEAHEYSGLHKDHHLNHHTGHSVDLECHAGSVVVNFQEPSV